MNIPNAKIWINYKGSIVKLTLKPNQTIHTYEYKPTDEGFHAIGHSYRHDGENIHNSWMDEGRDCDGMHAVYGECYCRIDETQDNVLMSQNAKGEEYIEAYYPNWQKLESDEVYDQYAQLAGY